MIMQNPEIEWPVLETPKIERQVKKQLELVPFPLSKEEKEEEIEVKERE